MLLSLPIVAAKAKFKRPRRSTPRHHESPQRFCHATFTLCICITIWLFIEIDNAVQQLHFVGLEEAISKFIKREYNDLPLAHERILSPAIAQAFWGWGDWACFSYKHVVNVRTWSPNQTIIPTSNTNTNTTAFLQYGVGNKSYHYHVYH